MLKNVMQIGLVATSVGVGIGAAEAANAAGVVVPELTSDVQSAVCLNRWNAALRAINPAIANPTISPEYRAELITFRRHLQDWRAVSAKVSDLPGCEQYSAAIAIPVEYPSAPLDFAAAARSIAILNSLPRGYIGYDGLTGVGLSTQDCWMVDQQGRRIDLSTVCQGGVPSSSLSFY
jgi:hypothetical protein